MSKLTRFLGLSAETNDALDEGTEKLQTASEFLDGVAEKLTDADAGSLVDLVEVPWVEGAAEVVARQSRPSKRFSRSWVGSRRSRTPVRSAFSPSPSRIKRHWPAPRSASSRIPTTAPG